MLIIVCGLPGTGKTTLAAALAEKLGAGHISSDVTRKRMFSRPTYSEDEKEAVYKRMAEEAANALSEGRDAIADATFYRASERARFRRIAESAGTKAFVIVCYLPEAEVKRRLVGRRGGPSDADFGVYLKVRETFEPVAGSHLEADMSVPLEGNVKRAMEFVGR